ncbi:MAG TPA: hypothetical protein VFV92_08895 [Candidatus Bathyarchaeia archaeon]|nr:hypothetical protein [Candidatus Bathyarchaeia archaeon]
MTTQYAARVQLIAYEMDDRGIVTSENVVESAESFVYHISTARELYRRAAAAAEAEHAS